MSKIVIQLVLNIVHTSKNMILKNLGDTLIKSDLMENL
jgi:hypothetical protein